MPTENRWVILTCKFSTESLETHRHKTRTVKLLYKMWLSSPKLKINAKQFLIIIMGFFSVPVCKQLIYWLM